MNHDIVLDVRKLTKCFPVMKGLWRRRAGEIRALDAVSFSMHSCEILGVCGESGCGKSTLARCVNRLHNLTSGQIIFEGEDISHTRESRLAEVRSRIALMFQDPYSSLDPRQKVQSIVVEPLKVHRSAKRDECRERASQLLMMVGLDTSLMDRYPHELSGGQRQRISIARAFALEPSLVIFDEPVSALDASVQAQIINLLKELHEQQEKRAYLFISHDMSLLRHLCDRVAVLYKGRIVEIADTEELYCNPLHPYTQMLLATASNPAISMNEADAFQGAEDDWRLSGGGPTGCGFRRWCSFVTSECCEMTPPLQEAGSMHEVACTKMRSASWASVG